MSCPKIALQKQKLVWQKKSQKNQDLVQKVANCIKDEVRQNG